MWDNIFSIIIAFLGFFISLFISVNMTNIVGPSEDTTAILLGVCILCGIVSASTSIIFLKLNAVLKQLKKVQR